ncbi:nucleotide-binding alpha-beta plait domain-containing protein [Tanacetum coccineum]
MGSFRSKKDDVAKLSTSIFVLNFPDSVLAKDLFHSCKQYGHVVDSFIPMKRCGKRQAIWVCRFINEFLVWRIGTDSCSCPLSEKKNVLILRIYLILDWFLLELINTEAKELFRDKVGVGSCYSVLRQASPMTSLLRLKNLPAGYPSSPKTKSDDHSEQESSVLHSLILVYIVMEKDNVASRVKSDVIREVNDENPSLKYPPGFTPSVEKNDSDVLKLILQDQGNSRCQKYHCGSILSVMRNYEVEILEDAPGMNSNTMRNLCCKLKSQGENPAWFTSTDQQKDLSVRMLYRVSGLPDKFVQKNKTLHESRRSERCIPSSVRVGDGFKCWLAHYLFIAIDGGTVWVPLKISGSFRESIEAMIAAKCIPVYSLGYEMG